MALSGTLKDFGIADILQLIGHQTKTGRLTLKTGAHEVEVFFVEGNVVFASEKARDSKDLLGSLLLRGRQGVQHVAGNQTVAHDSIPPQLSVAKLQCALRKLGYIMLMRYQHDRQSLLVVKILEDLHDLDRCPAVKIPGRLVS